MEDLCSQLQAVKLKKTSGPTRDFSSPKKAGFLSEAEVAKYQQSVLDVNTEEWLHLLKDFTFPSTYLPLSIEEAQMFVRIYEKLFQKLDPESISKVEWQENISQEDSVKILSMTEKLQKEIDDFRESKDNFVFVKLSSRSPKDAPMAQTRFKALYHKFLFKEVEKDKMSENTQITCILKAGFESLKISVANDIIDMCLRSERTYQDLLLALAIPERYRENWVIRHFVNIDVDMEFRGFVYNKKLVALSQYNYLIFSKKLVDNRNHYLTILDKFFNEKIKPNMESFLPEYIIDFAVCENDEIWVIEINPYMTTTDAALFSWEHELSILQGDQDSLVFRLTEKPRHGAKAMLPRGIRELIDQSTDTEEV